MPNENQPETEQEKPKEIPEANGYRHQCFLLDNVYTIKYGAFQNFPNRMIPWNDRMAFFDDDESALFYNYLTCPDFNDYDIFSNQEEWTNVPNIQLNIFKNENKINVIQAMIDGHKTSAKVTSIKLDFNGTNPASSRADIKVVVNIELMNGIAALDNEYKEKFKLVDLITRPEFYENTPGAGLSRHRKNQYEPEYNKVELVVTSKFYSGEQTASTKVQLDDGTFKSIDNYKKQFAHTVTYPLAMVDHELNYAVGKENKINLTITYHSFIDVQLNMPFMDALAGRGGDKYHKNDIEITYKDSSGNDSIFNLQNKPYGLIGRQERDEELSKLIVNRPQDKAKVKAIREKNKKINSEEIKKAKSRIVSSLFNQGLIYTFEDKSGNAPSMESEQFEFNGFVNKDNYKILLTLGSETSDGVLFFFLGDLIGVLSDLFTNENYPNPYSTYNNFFDKKLQPKFIFLNLKLPENNNNHNSINIAEIPISLKFFESYMEENYTKKNIETAPIMNFIRSFIEKAITKAINEVCFVASDEPWKGRIEVRSFRALKSAWENLRAGGTGADLQKRIYDKKMANSSIPTDEVGLYRRGTLAQLYPNGNHSTTTSIREAFRGKFGTIAGKQEDYYEYIVIYPTSQTNSRKILDQLFSNDQSERNQANKYVPVITDKEFINAKKGDDGKPNRSEGNYTGTKLSFKRTDMKYRREAVYSSYQADQFLAVGNVYNCTVNSSHGLFNWFFPGHYVIIKPFTSKSYNYWASDSMAAKLGLVGAYLVTKVSLNLDLDKKQYTTQMETMFESSGLDGLIRKEKDGDDEDPTNKSEQQGEDGNQVNNGTSQLPEGSSGTTDGGTSGGGGTGGGTGQDNNQDEIVSGNPEDA